MRSQVEEVGMELRKGGQIWEWKIIDEGLAEKADFFNKFQEFHCCHVRLYTVLYVWELYKNKEYDFA